MRQKSEAGDKRLVPQAVGMYDVAFRETSNSDFVISVTRYYEFVIVNNQLKIHKKLSETITAM